MSFVNHWFSKSFSFRLRSPATAFALLAFPVLVYAQSSHSKAMPMWKEARTPAAKGTRGSIPPEIQRQIEAAKLAPAETTEAPEDPCNSKERRKLTAYRVSLRGRSDRGVLIRAANSCYCGATGNCLFWVFRAAKSGYQLLLQTDLVQDYGLLGAKTLGYRDLVDPTDQLGQCERYINQMRTEVKLPQRLYYHPHYKTATRSDGLTFIQAELRFVEVAGEQSKKKEFFVNFNLDKVFDLRSAKSTATIHANLLAQRTP